MENKKLLDKSKKTVLRILKIRRGMKIFFAFGTGVATGITAYRNLMQFYGEFTYSLTCAILAGTAATAFALLVIKITRMIVRKLVSMGTVLYNRIKNKYKKADLPQQTEQ